MRDLALARSSHGTFALNFDFIPNDFRLEYWAVFLQAHAVVILGKPTCKCLLVGPCEADICTSWLHLLQS